MKRKWLVCMLLLFCYLCGTGCGKEAVSFGTDDIMLTDNIESVVEEEQKKEDADRKDNDSEIQGMTQNAKVYVFVCGAVACEGVYELNVDSRVQDALLAAGGFLPEADTDVVNLADIVSDGQKIYFPFEGENTELFRDDEQSETSDGRVNINTATKEQLMELPGIGNAKAESIIRYRESNGNFKDIQDIKNVSGIGDSIFRQIEEWIIVS